jgi:hypothetical protein
MDSPAPIELTPKAPETDPVKGAAVTALAIVGFIALLILGIALAIFSSQYVPQAVSKLGTEVGSSANTPNTLSVLTASSTPASGDELLTVNTTTLTPPSTGTSTNATAPASNASTAAAPATTPSESSSAPAHSRGLYGLPDLATKIIATGYLAGPDTSSFVPASIIPPGARPAVEFSIANNGTNSSGPWNFLAEIPSKGNQVFTSPTEPSLNPGDHTVFTLGFNEAIPGPAQTITVIADPNDNIVESNEGNNSASAAVTITQTGN